MLQEQQPGQMGAIPKVRDSCLGTSAASGSVLEESLRMMRDSTSAQEWHDSTMRAVERLETAVRERRVSDARRQRKEILPLGRRMEQELPRDAQAWPALNRQAMLEHMFDAVEGAVALADSPTG